MEFEITNFKTLEMNGKEFEKWMVLDARRFQLLCDCFWLRRPVILVAFTSFPRFHLIDINDSIYMQTTPRGKHLQSATSDSCRAAQGQYFVNYPVHVLPGLARMASIHENEEHIKWLFLEGVKLIPWSETSVQKQREMTRNCSIQRGNQRRDGRRKERKQEYKWKN